MRASPALVVLCALAACNGARGREPSTIPPPATHLPNLLPPLPEVAAAPATDALAAAPPPPADPLAAFKAAIHEMRNGTPGRLVRVAHFGDSHTAADALTGRLRDSLQADLGDGGHGFIVPAWADARLHRGVVLRDGGAWTVDRVRYQHGTDAGDRLIGIGTVSVRAAIAGTWAQVTGRGSSFDIYYLEQPSGGSFDVRVDGAEPLRVPTAGDAVRAGFHRVDVPNGRHVLELRVVGDGEVRLFGVQIERPGPGIVYSSLGVTGARASTPLEWNEALFTAQVRRMHPDLIVTMYGTNDLFADDYSLDRFGIVIGQLLSRARAAAPDASCLVLAPPDVAKRGPGGEVASVAELPALVARMKEEAAREGCAFWDTLAAMGGPGSILTWRAARPPLAAHDNVHLTRGGYERIAEALAGEVFLPVTRE